MWISDLSNLSFIIYLFFLSTNLPNIFTAFLENIFYRVRSVNKLEMLLSSQRQVKTLFNSFPLMWNEFEMKREIGLLRWENSFDTPFPKRLCGERVSTLVDGKLAKPEMNLPLGEEKLINILRRLFRFWHCNYSSIFTIYK